LRACVLGEPLSALFRGGAGRDGRVHIRDITKPAEWRSLFFNTLGWSCILAMAVLAIFRGLLKRDRGTTAPAIRSQGGLHKKDGSGHTGRAREDEADCFYFVMTAAVFGWLLPPARIRLAL